jgi:hypothetical protein
VINLRGYPLFTTQSNGLALEDLPPDKVPEPRQQVSATKVVNNKVPILGVVNPNLSIF